MKKGIIHNSPLLFITARCYAILRRLRESVHISSSSFSQFEAVAHCGCFEFCPWLGGFTKVPTDGGESLLCNLPLLHRRPDQAMGRPLGLKRYNQTQMVSLRQVLRGPTCKSYILVLVGRLITG